MVAAHTAAAAESAHQGWQAGALDVIEVPFSRGEGGRCPGAPGDLHRSARSVGCWWSPTTPAVRGPRSAERFESLDEVEVEIVGARRTRAIPHWVTRAGRLRARGPCAPRRWRPRGPEADPGTQAGGGTRPSSISRSGDLGARRGGRLSEYAGALTLTRPETRWRTWSRPRRSSSTGPTSAHAEGAKTGGPGANVSRAREPRTARARAHPHRRRRRAERVRADQCARAARHRRALRRQRRGGARHPAQRVESTSCSWT